jgi:hypothetical protein
MGQRDGPFEASSTRGILARGILAKHKIILSQLIYALTIDFFRRLLKNGVAMVAELSSSASTKVQSCGVTPLVALGKVTV